MNYVLRIDIPSDVEGEDFILGTYFTYGAAASALIKFVENEVFMLTPKSVHFCDWQNLKIWLKKRPARNFERKLNSAGGYIHMQITEENVYIDANK